jgi:hypothetical protein
MLNKQINIKKYINLLSIFFKNVFFTLFLIFAPGGLILLTLYLINRRVSKNDQSARDSSILSENTKR